MRPPEKNCYPAIFQHLSQLSFYYIQCVYLWDGAVLFSRRQLSVLLSNYYLPHVLFNSIVSAFLTFPLLSPHCLTPQSVSKDQLADCQDLFFFFACFQDLLSLFSLSLQFSLCHLNIYRQIPAQREGGKKDDLSCVLRSPPVHWHTHRSWLHTFLNAIQMWSTNVWQHFFFLQRKTNVGQKCSLLALRSQWYKNKFRFIPEFQTFPHGGWDSTVWFRIIAMLLFGVGGVLWNIGIETSLWKATDEMWLLHFQLRSYSESFAIRVHAESSLARPHISVCQATAGLRQIYVLSVTKHTSVQAFAVLLFIFCTHLNHHIKSF